MVEVGLVDSRSFVQKLFNEMDINKDNKVTLDEFKRCAKNAGACLCSIADPQASPTG